MTLTEIGLVDANTPRVEVVRLVRIFVRFRMHDVWNRVKAVLCKHEDWSFETQGRRCFGCGAWMVDFGD